MIGAWNGHLGRLIDLALCEDVGTGDVTTMALVPDESIGRAGIVAREPLVVSGLGAAVAVLRRVEPALAIEASVSEGDEVEAGTLLLALEGRLAPILTAERTALNFLQRLSGVATLTRRYVRALEGSRTRLLDTRKTTPGWRSLEKAAVRHGGAHNHRVALFDGVLIKDNHLLATGNLESAIGRARERAPALVKIEVEVEDIATLRRAIDAGADVVMLDNMSDEEIREAVAVAAGRVLLEASGGITLERLPALAGTGVDFVSCGALTHSATAVDIALDLSS